MAKRVPNLTALETQMMGERKVPIYVYFNSIKFYANSILRLVDTLQRYGGQPINTRGGDLLAKRIVKGKRKKPCP